MKVCTCFLLFGILAYAHSSNQRRVNLALETVLEFNNKDKEVDIKFLNNVQNFLTKVKTVIDENSNGNHLRRNFKASRFKTFTGFIQGVIQILNTYEDTAFTDFFDILDEEIRNYHYRGCRFYELTENDEIRKVIAAKLESIKGKPTSVTRAHINALSDMLKDDNDDTNVKEIVHYMNSLYRQAGENFQKVITDLEAYGRSKSKRSNNNLGKIIKNGVRSIIFDHYTNLNSNVRRDVKQKIKTFWKQLNKNSPSRVTIPNVQPYSKSRKNAKNSENIMNEVKKPEPASRKDLINIASKKSNKKKQVIKRHENNRDENYIKQSEYKKVEMKRDDLINSRKDIVNEPLGTQEKEIRLIPQHTGPMDQQKTKNEHQEQLNTDSLYGESFSSIEFYYEPQHNITQYTAIIPAKKSQEPSMNAAKKLEKIEVLNVTTRIPTNNTVKKIWIEESTGRLPKAVLDKLAIKPNGHESKHNMTGDSFNKPSHKHKKKYDKDQKKWHGKIYEPKYDKMDGKMHDKKYYTKYDLRLKQKLKQDKKHKNEKTSEPNDPFILVHNRDFFRQNYVRTTDSVFNMEVHQYKKSMGPLREQLKQDKRWSTASTKAQKFLEVLDVLMLSKSGKTTKSPRARRTAALGVKFNELRRMRQTQQISPPRLTNSSMRRLDLAVPRAYSKTNKMLTWQPESHFRKSAEFPSSSNEGTTVETSEIKDDKRRYGQNAKKTYSSLENDPYVIQRINNLERQFNEVKSRFNVNTDVVKARKPKHRYGANDNLVKRKQSKTRFRSDVHMIPNDFKDRTDKPKMAGTADNKTERIIESKNVKVDNSTKNEIGNDLEKGEKSETRFRSFINMIHNYSKDSTDKTEVTKTEDNKADVKYIDFKKTEEMVDNDYEPIEVTKQQAILKEDKITETSRTNIVEVTPKANDRAIKVVMNDHNDDDGSKATGTQNWKIASLSTSTKVTESTTNTTTTVQPTVAVTTPTTLKLANVLQKAEFNATVNESKNKMADNTSQVAGVSKSALNVTKEVTSELLNKNVTNFQSDVTQKNI